MNPPVEFIVQMYYWPQHRIDNKQAPDLFFNHVDLTVSKGQAPYTWDQTAEVVIQVAELLVSACEDKYKLKRLNQHDCLWVVAPR